MCTAKLLTDGACSLNNNGDVEGVHWKRNVFFSLARRVTTVILLSQINAVKYSSDAVTDHQTSFHTEECYLLGCGTV
jgi:hypothetical protein